MLKRIWLAPALVLLLAGCATPQPDLPPLVHIAPADCALEPQISRARVLNFDAEGKEKPESITIDESSACFGNGESESLYEIFALPDPGYSYMVTVRSLPSTSGIFAPRLIMLDPEGKQLREIDRDTFLFRGSALTAILRTEDGERYMAVASDPKIVGGDISRLSGQVHQQMVSTGAFMFAVYTGSESTANLTYAHNGRVEVSARPIPTSK